MHVPFRQPHHQIQAVCTFLHLPGIEEVVKFYHRRLPSCSNLALCQMLKTSQTLSLDIGIVVVVTIDLTAMFTRCGSPRTSVRRRAIRKLHFKRLLLPIKITSEKPVQLFSFLTIRSLAVNSRRMSRRRLMRMSRAASCLSVALSSARRFLCS